MNTPGDSAPNPVHPPVTPPAYRELNDRGRRRAPSMVRGPGRMVALGVASLAVMAPWPLLGIALMHSQFDRDSEAFMLFGGVTLFPLMILALFGSPPEHVLIGLFMLVWVAVALVPGLWFRRRLVSWTAIGVLLGVQSAFSFAQAAMGAMLIIGKSV